MDHQEKKVALGKRVFEVLEKTVLTGRTNELEEYIGELRRLFFPPELSTEIHGDAYVSWFQTGFERGFQETALSLGMKTKPPKIAPPFIPVGIPLAELSYAASYHGLVCGHKAAQITRERQKRDYESRQAT